jgi:predicted alpha/beta-hydrolase family hydrolase
VFFGFPLHAAGKPSDQRAAHLFQVAVPMLFLQGAKDKLAELSLLEPMLHKLGRNASLHIVADADHSFHVPARSGRRDADVMTEILDAVAAWAGKLIAA